MTRHPTATEKHRAILNAINVAAGVMLQTLHRRGRHPWPADMIVDPRLLATHGRGRSTKPGLELAVDAMEAFIALEDCTVHAASLWVARHMRNFWHDWWQEWIGSQGELARLKGQTLAAQLRRAYYHRRRRKI